MKQLGSLTTRPGSECPVCGGPMLDPVSDHCHECGQPLAWVCDACNKVMTEHVRGVPEFGAKMDRYHAAHKCHPRLPIDVPQLVRKTRDGETRRVYFSNGGGNPRYYMASPYPWLWTVEQFAAALGVNANTARVIARSVETTATVSGSALFIPIDDGAAIVAERISSE